MKNRTNSASGRSLNIGAVLADRDLMRNLKKRGVTLEVMKALAIAATKTNPAHLKQARKRNRLRLAADLRRVAGELRAWACGAVRYAFLSDLIQLVEAAGAKDLTVPRSQLQALAGYPKRFDRIPSGLEELACALDGQAGNRNARAAAGWLERAERARVLAPRGRPIEPATRMAHHLSEVLRSKSGQPHFKLVADVYNLASGRSGRNELSDQDLASLVKKHADRIA